MADAPQLPASPMTPEDSAAPAEVRLPWVTLLYALACGAALGVAGAVLSQASGRGPAGYGLWARAALHIGGVALIMSLAAAAADRVAAGMSVPLRWAAVLTLLSLWPVCLGPPSTLRSALGAAVFVAVTFGPSGAAAGAVLGWLARARSGLLWRAPLAAAVAALAAPAGLGAVMVYFGAGPQWRTDALSGYLLAAPPLVACALAIALGLRTLGHRPATPRDSQTRVGARRERR
jgi:hypothetical protein